MDETMIGILAGLVVGAVCASIGFAAARRLEPQESHLPRVFKVDVPEGVTHATINISQLGESAMNTRVHFPGAADDSEPATEGDER